MPIDLSRTDAVLDRLGSKPEAVIPVLQALQEQYGYLPDEALQHVCHRTQITPAAIAGVASFYDMFRLRPTGRNIVRVCRGTACHVAGVERVEDALRRQLGIPAGADTDPAGQFTVEPVACLGVCTMAPVLRIGEKTFGHASTEGMPKLLRDFHEHQAEATNVSSTEEVIAGSNRVGAIQIHVGLGSCCMAKGSDLLFHALRECAAETGGRVVVKRVGCVGMCHRTPMVEVTQPGRSGAYYSGLTPSLAPALIQSQLRPRGGLKWAGQLWIRLLDGVLFDGPTGSRRLQRLATTQRSSEVRAFFSKQQRIATEHFGRVDPLDLDEYVANEGFLALKKRLNQGASPDKTDIVATIERSGLRGRGGAGFPTGQKWRVVAQQASKAKYVICNGDEGDPGAFMDRMILESFPFRVIEGLALAAVAVGAEEGIFYIRNEYPLAVKRIRAAIGQMEKRGWLGEKLLGIGGHFRLSVFEGAGAFVCGEETALIASIEGKRGMPRLRPPFPAQEGLWGKPTLINNVETLAMVPWILRNGAEQFAAIGTEKSKGTKVFALAGKVLRGGLIEVPMGTTLREIVEQIGGGVGAGRRFKAVQIGGPSGGCVPAQLADTPVDFESLREVGAIMGSGGLVVLDDTSCMVDLARYFLQFTQDQSCGKCTFCRIGTRRMLDMLERLCVGKATRQNLDDLDRLAAQVGAGSLCGLGKTAPNPVLTTLRYFRNEYEAHLQGRCPAGKCAALIKYSINREGTGCTLCAQHCPVDAIPMTPYERHVIDDSKCTRCDSCRQVCPDNAVEVK